MAAARPSSPVPVNPLFDLQYLHPSASPNDFYPNGKLLPDQEIKQLLQKLKHLHENMRYSKKYLATLNIHINRGGVLKIYDPDKKKYELFATYKSVNTGKSLVAGQGAYGKVKIIQNLETGEFKVIKISRKEEMYDLLNHEAEGLAKLKRGYSCVIPKKLTNGQADRQKICIVQDFVRGIRLYDVLKAGRLDAAERFDIAIKLLEALNKLHSEGMLHRDIKPENIMYDAQKKTITIVDLGFWVSTNVQTPIPVVGTEGYKSPETYLGDYSTQSDIFAVGRVMQDLFGVYDNPAPNPNSFGKLDINARQIISRISASKFLQLEDLIHQMLNWHPDERTDLHSVSQNLQKIYFGEIIAEKKKVAPSAQSKAISASMSAATLVANAEKALLKKQITQPLDLSRTTLQSILDYIVGKQPEFTKEQTTTIKNQCFNYASWLIDKFVLKEISLLELRDTINQITLKLETLPHRGRISQFTSRLTKNISDEAKIMRESYNALCAIPTHRNNSPLPITSIQDATKKLYQALCSCHDPQKASICNNLIANLTAFERSTNLSYLEKATELVQTFNLLVKDKPIDEDSASLITTVTIVEKYLIEVTEKHNKFLEKPLPIPRR
jgi:serine/threonine protein kinase